MKEIVIVILAAITIFAANAWAGGTGDAVEVSITTDDGRTLPVYPVKIRGGLHKVYAEATKGDHYRIEVQNRLNRRIGLVIAVDGRNIISGEKSLLKNNERMYILEPYASGEFSGWRTAQDRINRFYFTDAPDSYAAAFGDQSAMGVIAVSVYPEVKRCEPSTNILRKDPTYSTRKESKAGSASKAESAPAAPRAFDVQMKDKAAAVEQAMESAGTGYGRDEYSPSRIVSFEPEKRAVENIFIKYEWRSTLCRLGVTSCTRVPCRPYNRLWDNAGFAPPPPRF
ncbi:MAG: hypothetical protein ABFD57_03615 [Smithella sp.]